MVFTKEGMVDMLLIYRECSQNAKQEEQRYAERRHPTRPTVSNIVSKLRETGSLSPRKQIGNKTVTNESAEVAVLAMLDVFICELKKVN